MTSRKAILALVFLGLPAVTRAQTIFDLVQKGDTILGMGGVDTIDNIAVNDAKVWLGVVDTTFDDINKDGALLRNGFVTLRQNQLLPDNITLVDFKSIDINSKGDLGMAVTIKLPQVATHDALAWNSKIIARELGPVNSPFVGAGTIWDSFNSVKINDKNQMFVVGKLQNPIVQGLREDFAATFQLDDAGNVLSMTIQATRQQSIPALGTIITSVPGAETAVALNNKGDFVTYFVTTAFNGVVKNMDTQLATEGLLSSVGRGWFSLNASKVSINDHGDTLLSGVLVGDVDTDFLVEKNGAKFVQEGDILPLLSNQPIDGGNAARMVLTNSGDVFWRTTTKNTSEDAFMRNFTPILVKGRTLVDGHLVTQVESLDSALAASPNGRFFVGNVDLQGVGEALVFVDFGLVLELPGCFGNPGKLSVTSGAARVGSHIEFSMDHGHVPGAVARINFASRLRRPGSDCGVVGPVGEMMLSPAHRVGNLVLPRWDGVNPTKLDVVIPPVLSLVDGVIFAQGNFRTPTSRIDITLTNALRIEIGAP